MEDLLAIAAQVREHYLRAFLSSVAKFKAAHTPSAPEVMFELQRDEPLPFRLFRADMAANVNGEAKIQEVNTSTHLSFEPFEVKVTDGLVCSVKPIVWNDIGLHANATIAYERLEAWAMRWLDLHDKFAQDENGLQGVIHSISGRGTEDGSTRLSIDFGSAPVSALEELLHLASQAGASRAFIHSASLE